MSDLSRVAGGPRGGDLPQVSADQSTILGNGTRDDPLRAGAGAALFSASGRTRHRGKVQVGDTVAATSAPPSVGIASVDQASAGISGPAQAIGIVVADGAGDEVTVQSAGAVVLTADVWDAHTGDSGGLTPGAPYYLSNVSGQITTTAPSVSGTSVVQVGVALNPTTLLLSTPAFPRPNP